MPEKTAARKTLSALFASSSQETGNPPQLDVVDDTLQWSDEVYHIHGRTREEYSPDVASAIEHYHPDDRDDVSTCISQAIEHRKDFEFERRIVRSDGEVRLVIARGRPEFGEDGVRSIIGIFHDITEERAREAQRFRSLESLRAKAMIAAGAAGVLRKPFNVQELEDKLSEAIGRQPSQSPRPASKPPEARTAQERPPR